MVKYYLYAAVILALLAFAYWYSERQYQAGVTATVADYEQRDNEELRKERAAHAETATQLSALSSDLAQAQRQIEIKAREVRELERQYETANQRSTACNLTLGSIVLHNSALGYNYDSGELADKGREVSGLTAGEFIRHCNGLASDYERQRIQLNSLVDAAAFCR